MSKATAKSAVPDGGTGRAPWAAWMLIGLLVFAAVWYIWSYSRTSPAQRTSTGTSTSAGCLARPAQVTVNVYNANGKDKLAQRVATSLKGRGFKVGKVTNSSTFAGDAQVRHSSGQTGTAAGDLVAAQLSNASTSTKSGLKARTVDLVLGKSFTSLGPAATASSGCS